MDLSQPVEQVNFHRRFGTNDHLQSIKTNIEKTTEYNRPVILAIIDIHKAFDTIELKANTSRMYSLFSIFQTHVQ